MNWMALVDGPSAAIVAGGTLLATVMRCGIADCRAALRAVARLGRRRFDADFARARLCVQIRAIHADGLYRAEPVDLSDPSLADATGALLTARSPDALLARHRADRARRMAQAERAVRTLAQAAELAPVFGLAGTLVSLSQLSVDGAGRGSLPAAIAMAVVTTLYGLLAANLLLAPLARMIERAALGEERARQAVIDWLAEEVAAVLPPARASAGGPS